MKPFNERLQEAKESAAISPEFGRDLIDRYEKMRDLVLGVTSTTPSGTVASTLGLPIPNRTGWHQRSVADIFKEIES